MDFASRDQTPETVEVVVPAPMASPEDLVARGGRAIGCLRESLPVMRAAARDRSIPEEWRARIQMLADRYDQVLACRL